MRAYHGDEAVKAKYLARVRAHREADQLVQGYGYWSDGKGCAVGCTIHGGNHGAYEVELGIPSRIAYLEDRTFERLPAELARTWPERFLEAVPIGADLSQVMDRWFVWMLTDETHGVRRHAKTEGVKEAVQKVANRYQERIDGKDPGAVMSREDWDKLRDETWAVYQAARERFYAAAAADAAAAAAADADADAADADAADAAAAAAAAAAADAAAAAWRRGCGEKWLAVRQAWTIASSEKLLQLLREAPVTTDQPALKAA